MYLPTPQKIAEETAKIRSGWSKRELSMRTVLRRRNKLGIKIISTAFIDDPTREESAGWQYLDGTELKTRRRRKKTESVQEDEVPEEEVQERMLFQATVVIFGF